MTPGDPGGPPPTAPKVSSAAPRSAAELAEQANDPRAKTRAMMPDVVSNLHRRIDSDFVYHPPNPGQPELYEQLREQARAFAHFLADTVPPSRELSRALSDLEDCVMHANAGIARHG